MNPIPCNKCCKFSAPGPVCEHCGAKIRTPQEAKAAADMAVEAAAERAKP